MDVTEIRRRRLRSFIDDQCDGIAAKAAKKTGKQSTEISDMLADPPRKAFGEKVARRMEAKAGLRTKWFDEPYPEGNTIAGVRVGSVSHKEPSELTGEELAAVDLAGRAAQVALAWLALPEDERDTIKTAIEARAAWYLERRRAGLRMVKTEPPAIEPLRLSKKPKNGTD